MIYFTAHTFKCVCHCIRTMFRVLGVYNFAFFHENSPFMSTRCLPIEKLSAIKPIIKIRMQNNWTDINFHELAVPEPAILIGRETKGFL